MIEKNYIVAAFRFELTKVGVHAIRERVLSMLANVADELVSRVAAGLGIDAPSAQPRVLDAPVTPEVTTSSALSLFARPGDGSVKTLRVALLVADNVNAETLRQAHQALAAAGAVPRFVGPH